MKKFFDINRNFKSVQVPFTPTAENIAQFLFEHLQPRYKNIFDNNLKLIEVKLWETPTSVAIAN